MFPECLNLKLGEMNLDHRLQLILITTVIKHHLAQLVHAIQLYQTRHKKAPSMGVLEGMFTTTLVELKSSIEVLLLEAQQLLEQPRT